MEPEIWDGDYEKTFYYVHLPNGEKVECWPNAGNMYSTDGSGRSWTPEDKPLISIQPEEESHMPSIAKAAIDRRTHPKTLGSPVDIDGLPALRAHMALRHAGIAGLKVDFASMDEAGDPTVIEGAFVGVDHGGADDTAVVTGFYAAGHGMQIDNVDVIRRDARGSYPADSKLNNYYPAGARQLKPIRDGGAGAHLLRERRRAKRARGRG